MISSRDIIEHTLQFDNIYSEQDYIPQNKLDEELKNEKDLIEGYIRYPYIYEPDYLDTLDILSNYSESKVEVVTRTKYFEIFSPEPTRNIIRYQDKELVYYNPEYNRVLSPNTGHCLWSFTCYFLFTGDINCNCYLCLKKQGKLLQDYPAYLHYNSIRF